MVIFNKLKTLKANDWVIILFLGLFYIINHSIYLLNSPKVWIDEYLFLEPAYGLFAEFKLATSSLAELIPSFADVTYWQPPMFFIVYGVVLKLFGFGIIQGRLTSVILGLVLIFLLFKIIIQIVKDKRIAYLGIAILITDPVFLDCCRTARMEVLAMIFLLLGYLSTLKLLEKSNVKNALLCGTAFGLAVLTHPLGVIGVLALGLYLLFFERKILFSKNIIFVFLPAILLLVLWGIYIVQDFDAFIQQMKGQFARKIYMGKLDPRKIRLSYPQFYIMVVTIIYSTVVAVRKKELNTVFLVILFWVSLALSVYGREGWYFAFVLPWCVILFGIYLHQISNQLFRFKKTLLWGLLIFILGGNAIYQVKKVVNEQPWNHVLSYFEFSEEIAEVLPKGATVYLECLPDPHFVLWKSDKDFKVTEYCPIGGKLLQYIEQKAEYIVMSKEFLQYPSVLKPYLEKAEIVKEIGNEKRGYWARIYKLKKAEEIK